MLIEYRDTKISISQLEENGRQFFNSLYGEDANHVQGLLDSILPEIGMHQL
jgi:hypothetical protein